jgi:hypothetical protein
MLCPLRSKVESKAATSAELRRRRTIGEEITDWFMPPVNHLQAARKRMALPGAILFCEDVRHRGFLAWTLVIEAMVRVRL